MRMMFHIPLLAVLIAAGWACSDESDTEDTSTWIYHPTDPLPEQLSDLGLYLDFPDLQNTSKIARHYVPQHQLWSNGGNKDRFVVVPSNTTIDNTEGPWTFPDYTLFFKTFSFKRGEQSTPQPVETRLMRKLPDKWEFTSYLWSEDGLDAVRLAGQESTPVKVYDESGIEFRHEIPSEFDCRTCHESTVPQVLGFNALDLSTALPDHQASQLVELVDAGIFTRQETTPEVIPEPDPQTAQVLGYFQGNCVHCHNASGHAESALNLHYSTAVENIVNMPTDGSASAAGIRVVPGDPAQSILYLAVSGESTNPDIKAMPPLGVQRKDFEGINLLRTWITDLQAD